MSAVIVPPIDRLMRRVEKRPNFGCWQFTGPLRPDGYCQVQLTGKRGKKVLGHRLTYETYVGPVPEGLDLDHMCRNRGCVNPAHLEPVTRQINILRGTAPERTIEYFDEFWANRTHCPNGHELAVVGIDVESGTGHRQCRACHLQQKRENYQRVMADPIKAERRREQNRRARARYLARKRTATA